MGPQSDDVPRILARLASRSHGVVTRRELLGAGLTAKQVRRRVRSGLLIRVHPGVYRVGHRAPSAEAEYVAAVRACGDGAALSGLAAAHLWGLVRRRPSRPEVTAPTARSVKGVATRRSRSIEHTTWRGVPVTTVARTLVDVAAVLDEGGLARACHEAQVRHGLRPEQVAAVLARRPRAKGAGTLRAVLWGGTGVTLSALERRFLELLRAEGLPRPTTNSKVGGRYVDCRWAERRLTVELDSYRFHNTRHAWEQDRRRERDAYARGDDLRRYTWGDVVERPAQMLAELRSLLRGRAAA